LADAHSQNPRNSLLFLRFCQFCQVIFARALSARRPEIKNHLGHEDIQSTTVYLHLDLTRRKQIQKQFIEYMQSVLISDPKIEELFDRESKEDIMAWLDSL